MRIDLLDPEPYARDEFWSAFDWLRANEPVHWHPEPGGPGFWVVSRHSDIVRVYGDSKTFVSRHGMRLGTDPSAVKAVSDRMLIVSDPPAHTYLKRALAQAFAPAEMPAIDRLVRRVVDELVAAALDQGGLDFIDLAKELPNRVVCTMMGIPRADWSWIGSLTTEAFEADEGDGRSNAHAEIFLYFMDLLRHRRAEPQDDLVTRIAFDTPVAEPGMPQRGLTDEEIVFNCNGVLAGANETTRYSAAGGVRALAVDPAQWTRWRELGSGGTEGAVEEILRWTTPGVHAMRTAVSDTEIAGSLVAAGDRVTLWNVSANRDEAVFADAGRFLVDRQPNRHVTFGAGRHMCLGARLARLELGVLFDALREQVSGFELTGPVRFNSSNFTWGVTSLPVSFRRGRRGAEQYSGL
jgi:cytochrome P450